MDWKSAILLIEGVTREINMFVSYLYANNFIFTVFRKFNQT